MTEGDIQQHLRTFGIKYVSAHLKRGKTPHLVLFESHIHTYIYKDGEEYGERGGCKKKGLGHMGVMFSDLED